MSTTNKTVSSKNGLSTQEKVVAFEQLKDIRKKHPGKKIIHCHGVFDVLHFGHLAYLNSAKSMGDILVITVTIDKFVNKGPGRPYFTGPVRANMLASLEVVDYVSLSPYPTAVPVITELKPDYYVKGPDYKAKGNDVTGAILEEERAVNEAGGELAFTEDVQHSSSTLINKFFTQWSENQQLAIETVKKIGGYAAIEEALDRLSKIEVCVMGEPIVDTYVYCEPQALSSKSPSISAKYLYEEDYGGGSIAIANHLASFVKKASLLTTYGGEEFMTNLFKEKVDSRVELIARQLNGVPTPRKTRYIEPNNSQRFFEVTNLRSDQWTMHSPKEFLSDLMKMDGQDRNFIVADFGHGLVEGQVLSALGDLRGFIGLNVQTNSSNFGFNLFTKHRKFDFLAIDSREARLACHDRFSPALALARKIRADVGQKSALAITLGHDGSCYFPKGSSEEQMCPAFTDKVIDATGAGDAFFGLVSLLVRVDCKPELVSFLGNVFAGLKTKIIGNKSSVSKTALLKTCEAILK
jgi:rfaE bifunctional protein nucleotidyltransferase chain/domain